MKILKPIVSTIIIFASFSLIGCSSNSQTSGSPALFDTKLDAEKAAKNFNCTGAHKMGEKWMPCKSHEAREESGKNKSHNEYHNH